MRARMHNRIHFSFGIFATALMVASSLSWGQESSPFKSFIGEVNAENKVNVRSGPSTNHYVVCQLQAGQRVVVVDRKFSWLAIEPPQDSGISSLMKAVDIDDQGAGKGVVKTDQAEVYAAPTKSGIRADDHHSHPRLAKGAEVQILGTGEDGMIRIVPPVGAKFWISGDYVQEVPAERLERELNPKLPKVMGGQTAPDTQTPVEKAEPAIDAATAKPAPSDSTPVTEGTGEAAPPPASSTTVVEKSADPSVPIPMTYSTAPSSESLNPPGEFPTIISTAAGTTTVDKETPAVTPGTNRILEEIRNQSGSPDTVTDSGGVAASGQPAVSHASFSTFQTPPSPPLPIIEPQKPILPEGITDKALLTQLEAADNALYSEMLKPLAERSLDSSRQQFAALADQQGDVVVQAYAAKRVEQIDAMQNFIAAVKDAGVFAEKIRTERQQWYEQRIAIPQSTYTPDGKPDFVIQGILRPSLIYDSPTGPIRYRLVDPETDTPRTLAYVQLADGVQYDMNDFFERVVGVRAKERILLEGAVDAIPIYVANELVVLSDTYSGFAEQSPAVP